MTDKVISFPVVSGGRDCGEAEAMILLGQASDAGLTRVVIMGVDDQGNIFRETNATEIEAVALHESAKLHYFFESYGSQTRGPDGHSEKPQAREVRPRDRQG